MDILSYRAFLRALFAQKERALEDRASYMSRELLQADSKTQEK